MPGYSFDLGGRVVLVTGASSGIGEAFAKAAAASGARVVLAARRRDRLERIRDDIVAEGGAALAVELDVSSEGSTIAAFDAAEATFGAIDTVFANAGFAIGGAAIDLDIAELDRLFATNVRGMFLTAREGARRMIANGSPDHERGRIVLMSSMLAVSGQPGMAAYAASKAAVLQLGKVLAREWARKGINVNMILPGFIHTEMNDPLFTSGAGEKLIGQFPRRRLPAESDLLPTLLYLASDSSAAVTGAAFTIDDGQSL